MDLRIATYICVMLWFTMGVTLLRGGEVYSAIILTACASFVSGVTFQIWCCERRGHGRLP